MGLDRRFLEPMPKTKLSCLKRRNQKVIFNQNSTINKILIRSNSCLGKDLGFGRGRGKKASQTRPSSWWPDFKGPAHRTRSALHPSSSWGGHWASKGPCAQGHCTGLSLGIWPLCYLQPSPSYSPQLFKESLIYRNI